MLRCWSGCRLAASVHRLFNECVTMAASRDEDRVAEDRADGAGGGQQVDQQVPPPATITSCLKEDVPGRSMGSRLLWVTIVLVAALYFGASQTHDECSGPLVTTRQGQLCGRNVTDKGLSYLSFQGIPYAQPPVGKLRFKDPKPATQWSGVLKATRPGAVCLQSGQGAVVETLQPTLKQAVLLVRALPGIVSHLTSGQHQSEDCLFLNVYTRALEPGAPRTARPVMVWLHGGGFHMGSGGPDLYGPSYLIEEDVVLVTLNYRLGPLGFLSVPRGGVPGNAGLKDQNLALRWVRDNIAAFGGDPSRITLFGESAGGTSVLMHMLSPLSRGLFHRAISESGSALNPRSSVTAEEARDRAHRLARLVGVDTQDDLDLVNQLQQLPASVLAAKSELTLSPEERSRGLAVHPFVPSAELPGPGAFLGATPQQLMAAGDLAPVPYITGINSLEAGFMMNKVRDFSTLSLDKEMENLVPSDLGLQPGTPEHTEVARRMKRAYLGDTDTPTDHQMAMLYSDLFVSWVVHRTVNMLSRRAAPPLYVYLFSHDGGLSLSTRVLDRKLPGVYHGDELGYLFTANVLPSGRETEEDRVVSRRIVKLWANFAGSGDPNLGRSPLLATKWLPANNRSQLFLEIGKDLTMRKGMLSPFMGFWDSVYRLDQGGLKA